MLWCRCFVISFIAFLTFNFPGFTKSLPWEKYFISVCSTVSDPVWSVLLAVSVWQFGLSVCFSQSRHQQTSIARKFSSLPAWSCFWCRIHLRFRLIGGFCTQSRWRHSVTVTVKDGGYVLLWQRYDNNKMADICYYGNVMTTTRWRICVTMETLWQQQDGGYVLLWIRYDN